jgi:hypothetical protein
MFIFSVSSESPWQTEMKGGIPLTREFVRTSLVLDFFVRRPREKVLAPTSKPPSFDLPVGILLIWRDNSEIVGCSAHRAAGARPAGRPGGGRAAAGSGAVDNQEAADLAKAKLPKPQRWWRRAGLIRYFLGELGIVQKKTKVFEDNQAAISLATSLSVSGNSRHVVVRYARVREAVAN